MLHTICNMLKVLKSLADINLDFMKSYFTIKETPYTAYEIDLKKKKNHQYALRVIEQIQFYFGHVKCGISYLFLLKKSQSLIEFKSKIKAF